MVGRLRTDWFLPVVHKESLDSFAQVSFCPTLITKRMSAIPMVRFLKFGDVELHSEFGGIIEYSDFFNQDVRGHYVCRLVRGKRGKGKKREPTQPYHYHDKRDLYMVGVSGRRPILVNGKRYTLTPGTVLNIQAGDPHKSVDIGKDEFVCLEIWYSEPGDSQGGIPYKEK